MATRLWTPEEDAVLRARWVDETPDAIGHDLNRSREGVKSRARKLRLPHHKVGRPADIGAKSSNGYCENYFHAKQIRELHRRPITRDPFIAILFGACEAIKATALPSHVYRQSMSIDEELGEAA